MPDYNYECKKCKCQFEKTMTLAEKEKTDVTCPKCGGDAFQLFSKLNTVEDMSDPEIPSGPPPGGMGGMGGMPPGMGGMPPGMGMPPGCGF